MFENLQQRLTSSLKRISGNARLTEDNIADTLREVRLSLLEADVALPVVRVFIERVRERALGAQVQTSLTPGQQFLKIVQSELVSLMGESNQQLNLNTQPPAVILMAGLQGAGKTTTSAKLAAYLKEREGKKVMLASADVYRPAAIDQLKRLSVETGAEFFPSTQGQQPLQIAKEALAQARKQFIDVLILDTAGRLSVDQAMMDEIAALQSHLKPAETLFVIDAMTGQDAVATASAFNRVLELTGVVLTKADGDARGGAALSVRETIGKPIKFIGTGEKYSALEPFHPERIASRILGMGDVLSLIEEVERKVDQDKAQKLAKKIQRSKGKGFDLEDMRDQFQQMRNLGGMGGLLDKLPGMGNIGQLLEQSDAQKQFARMEAIINSMTPRERRQPEVLNGSRKRRITQGSGTTIQDLNRLLKQHKQMQKMMKKMGSAKGMGRMKQMMGSASAGGQASPGAFPGAGGVPAGGGLPFALRKNKFR